MGQCSGVEGGQASGRLPASAGMTAGRGAGHSMGGRLAPSTEPGPSTHRPTPTPSLRRRPQSILMPRHHHCGDVSRLKMGTGLRRYDVRFSSVTPPPPRNNPAAKNRPACAGRFQNTGRGVQPMRFASGKPLWRAKRNMSCTPRPISGRGRQGERDEGFALSPIGAPGRRGGGRRPGWPALWPSGWVQP
ncbi:MAG: hypothetical protein JWR75_1653 [Devosia sp.]|nr:hypothetical protein [Devosia sp.]